MQMRASGCSREHAQVAVLVDEADEHYKRAIEAGAEIVLNIKDQGYGGRGYSCKDPEGNIWNFGSYNPWAE